MNNSDDVNRINEIIAERFRGIEEKILAADTIAGLFETLLDGVEKEFGIPFVWISLVNSDDALPVIAGMQESEFLNDRYSVVSRELFELIFPDGIRPVLANKNLQPFYKLLPPSRKYFVRSIAVVPFTLGGQLIGTWNNGDADENRYEADMKTDFVENLAGHISLRLTQLVAYGKKESDPEGVAND